MFYHVGGMNDGKVYSRDRLVQPFDDDGPLRLTRVPRDSFGVSGFTQDASSFRCPIADCTSMFTQEDVWVEHVHASHRTWWSLLGSIESRMMLVLTGHTKGNSQQVRDEFWAGRSPTSLAIFKVLHKDVTRVTHDPREALIAVAIWQACMFFRHFPGRRYLSRSQPMDRITRLPIQIQLNILDQLEIYQADRVVRETYPHLIDRWCSSLATRFTDWFYELSSRENLRFMGVIDGKNTRVEIFRLRSVDLHPTVQVDEPYSPLPRLPPPALDQPFRQFSNVSALHYMREALFDAFYTLAFCLRLYNRDSITLRMWREEKNNHMVWDTYHHHVLTALLRKATNDPYITPPYAGITLENALRQVMATGPVPFLIPLNLHPKEEEDAPGEVDGDDSDDDDDMSVPDDDVAVTDDDNSDSDAESDADNTPPTAPFSKGVSYLLVYPDEIEAIIRNFEVIIRPDGSEPGFKAKYKMEWFLLLGVMAKCFVQEGAAGSVRAGARDRRFNAMMGEISEEWEELRGLGGWLGTH
jgi:hypothetical protein